MQRKYDDKDIVIYRGNQIWNEIFLKEWKYLIGAG